MIQPGNSYHTRVHNYPTWAADNGAFSANFDPDKFRALLARASLSKHKTSCLFAVAPDVMGNAQATLSLFADWAAEIRARGFPAALVAQDGLERALETVPWHLVDVLFVGGTTEWKLSEHARACVDHARSLGKRTHMGRVNSYKRLALAQSWGVDTADGTFLAFAPTTNVPRLLHWLDKLHA
jgi:hypothetical protein